MPINWCHSQGPSPKAYANWSIFFSLLQWNESAIAAWPILPYVFCHLCGQPGLASLVTSFRLTFNEWILQYFFFWCFLRCSRCVSRAWLCGNHLYILFRILFLSPQNKKREDFGFYVFSRAAKAASSTICKVNERKTHLHTYGYRVWRAHTSQTDSLRRQ